MDAELWKVCCDRTPVANEQSREIRRLVKAGADIHATDKNGVTALHRAVRFRSPAAVETLLKLGADVNQTCRRSGSTALHRAVTSTGAPGTSGRKEQAIAIIRLLIKHGADATIANDSAKLPAAYVSDPEILAALGHTTVESG